MKQEDIDFLKDWWNDSFSIEIKKPEKGKALLFEEIGRYDYNTGAYYPNEKRLLEKPDVEEYPKYEKFTKELEEEGLIGEYFTLDEAIELVKELL